MDVIKEAFERIKNDMNSLRSEIFLVKQQLLEMEKQNNDLKAELINLKASTPTHIPTHQPYISTENNPLVSTPTHIPTHQPYLKALNSLNNAISTGNRGVPTDNPTNKQTDQQTDKLGHFELKDKTQSLLDSSVNSPREMSINSLKTSDSFERAREILDSLDTIRKDIRLKFKRLTPQEMEVFSAIYSLQERFIEDISYRTIAQQLKLSESSIRDYITKLIAKGIPLLKIKRDNKKIEIKISADLQKIASLSTIMKLREL